MVELLLFKLNHWSFGVFLCLFCVLL